MIFRLNNQSKFLLNFLGPILLCHINLIRITNLDSLQTNSSFFCIIKLNESFYQTKIIKNTASSSKFNESFTLPVHDLYDQIEIRLFCRKENHQLVLIGKLKIDLPDRNDTKDIESYLKMIYKSDQIFKGTQFWLPFKSKQQPNKLLFIQLEISLINLTTDFARLHCRTFTQSNKRLTNLPVMLINAALRNVHLDHLNKNCKLTKSNKNFIFRVYANFNSNHELGQHCFVKNQSSFGQKIKEAKFCFMENSFQTSANELNFELELYDLNGEKELLPTKATIKLNDLILAKKNSMIKNITFHAPHKLVRSNQIDIVTAELFLTIQVVHNLSLDNFLFNSRFDEKLENLKPKSLNRISCQLDNYQFPYLDNPKQIKPEKELDELHPEINLKSKKDKKLNKKGQPILNLKDENIHKKDDCEILLAFHYYSNQLLLVDVIRLINVPLFSDDTLPNVVLRIELWKDKSRVACSLFEAKHQTRDPFFSVQIQFEINSNKLSNLFLRILILENLKKTLFLKGKSQLLAEAIIKIPDLEVGKSSEEKWFSFNRIGIF